jgi:hypothetical protein
MKRVLLLLPLGALLLGALAAAAWFDNGANRGVTFTPPARPLPQADGPQVGVNLLNLHAEPDPAVVSRSLEMARGMGARYARMQLPWEDIEIAGKGDFVDRRNDLDGDGSPDAVDAWRKYDYIVDTAASLGLSLTLRLERPPQWARARASATPEWQEGLTRDGNSTGPPDSLADYGDFVGRVAARYRGKVRFYQIWNEPNLKNEWNWQEPRPEDFVELLRVGASAVRAADPAAVVIFPSLSPVDGLDKRAPMTELEYLDRVYQAGGGAYFDVMSAQAYGLGQPPEEHRYVRLRSLDNWVWTRPLDTRADVSRIVLLREVMERHGDAGKAVWVGEFGWNSAPDTIPADRRTTWGEPVSEQQKGEYLVGMVERARQEWPWVGVMNVWMLRWGGAPPDPNDPTPYFALVERDFTPLPAYERLAAYLRQPTVAGVGAHTWGHAAVERIDGGWRLRFSGTRITLVGGLEGDVDPTLDGTPITLSRDGVDGMQALSADAPRDGDHTLEMRTSGDPPEWFTVERAPPPGWVWPLAVGLPTLLLAAWGAAMFGGPYRSRRSATGRR